MSFEELRQRLLSLDTASLCDANKALSGQLRVIAPAIRPIRPGLQMIGRAYTVSCHNDFLPVIKGLRDAEPGDVLVIDSQGSTKAVSGNLFPTEAVRKGLAGIVNDGPCRDTSIIRTMDIPYYARSVTCVPGMSNQLAESQTPVICGGVTVDPGDILFGDDDGIIVSTPDELAELIPIAQEVVAKEAKLIEGMKQGISLLDMLNFDEHCANLEGGRESCLEFRV